MAQEGFTRKFTLIFSADDAGYRRLMGEDKENAVQTLTTHREVMITFIQ
jgi:hypothetical protein